MLISKSLLRFRENIRNIRGKLENFLISGAEIESPKRWDRVKFHLAAYTHQVMSLYRDRRPGCAQIWQGKERESGHPMRVAYISGGKNFQQERSIIYLKRILFSDEDVQVEERPGVPLFGARRAAHAVAKEVDLVIAEGSVLLRWKPNYGQWRLVPLGVRMIIRFSPQRSWEEIEQDMHSHKNNIKKARKYGFTYEVTHNKDDFQYFFNRMYLPMMHVRHQRDDILDHEFGLYDQFRNGVLMLAREPGGMAVAGAILTFQGRTALSVANGMLDGDERWYKQGAISGLSYERIRWCYDNHFTCFDVGSTRSFIKDGLFEYKHNWGFIPGQEIGTDREWLFWVPSGSPVAVDWLDSHPSVPYP